MCLSVLTCHYAPQAITEATEAVNALRRGALLLAARAISEHLCEAADMAADLMWS